MLNGFNRRTGRRDRGYRRDGEYHLAPKCPLRDTPIGGRTPVSQERDKATRPSFSSISMDAPASAQKVVHRGRDETSGAREQSVCSSMDMGNLFLVSSEDKVVVLDSGAAANLGSFRRLERRNSLLEQHGSQRASAFPSKARRRSVDGRVGDVRCAVES